MYNYNTVYLRDKRYDVVLHLVTAADGGIKEYKTKKNNKNILDL